MLDAGLSHPLSPTSPLSLSLSLSFHPPSLPPSPSASYGGVSFGAASSGADAGACDALDALGRGVALALGGLVLFVALDYALRRWVGERETARNSERERGREREGKAAPARNPPRAPRVPSPSPPLPPPSPHCSRSAHRSAETLTGFRRCRVIYPLIGTSYVVLAQAHRRRGAAGQHHPRLRPSAARHSWCLHLLHPDCHPLRRRDDPRGHQYVAPPPSLPPSLPSRAGRSTVCLRALSPRRPRSGTSKKHSQKSFLYRLSLRHWLGDGLLISYGPKWHTRRHMITPTFHFDVRRDGWNLDGTGRGD